VSELQEKLTAQLKSLRQAGDQKSAIECMKGAYQLMEECIDALKERPAQIIKERLVSLPAERKIEVAQELPRNPLVPIYSRPPVWVRGNTIVYPEQPMPIPKPLSSPRPWTKADTRRLERAIIQKRGR